MGNQTKSLKNLLFSGLNLCVTVAFGFLLPRLFVVTYGSEVNGLLNSLAQLLVYLGLFEAGVGTATMQALYKPLAEDDWSGVSGVLAATDRHYKKTGLWYLIGLLVLAFIYPAVVESGLSYWTVWGAIFFSGFGSVLSFWCYGKYAYLLRADGKGYIGAILSTVGTVLVSLCKVVLIRLGVNIVWILAASFAIGCLQCVFILWYVRRYKQLDLSASPNEAAISQKNAVLVHQISALVFQNTDVLILTVFCDLRVVSVYAIYRMVTSQIESVVGIFPNSVSFVMGQNYQLNKDLYKKRADLLDSYYGALVYGLFAVALFLFLPFMRLYTAGVTDINYVDPWLAVLFVAGSLLNKSRTVMGQTINYAGHYHKTLWRSVLESVINLTVSLVGAHFLGIYGVLLGTVAALSYRTADIILYANRKLLDRSAGRTLAIYGVDIALFVLLQILLQKLFSGIAIDSYGIFILVGLGATAISLTVMLLGQTLLMPHCRSFIKEQLLARRAVKK